MASDGQIGIDITVDGTQVTTANTALGTLATSAQSAGGQADALGKQTGKASMSIKDMAVSLGLVAVAAKAFSILKSSLDSAISRFDTMNAFPRIMEQMGFSSEQATKSIGKMADGIQGLPTTLDGIVKSAQNIAIMTGDLDMATDTALALNNAFLASGSSSVDAERGLTQYVQMLAKGSVDMQSWKTLQETMGYGLNETAKAFGFTGAAAQRDLYDALKDGDITFDAFNAKIVELSGGVGGFAEVALTSSAGIGTSMQNLKNAVTVGVANMIVSFDNLSRATTGKTIAENMDGLKVVVKAAFTVIGKAIEGAAPIVTVFAAAITALIPVVKTLSPAIIGLTAAFAAYMVIQKAGAAVAAAQVALKAAQATTLALTVATNARTAAQIVMTTTDRAGTAVTVASTSAVTLSTLAIGVMTGSITIATAAIAIKTTATLAWGAAIKFLMGPVGWVIAAIGLLVTGIVALVKWFNRTTEEGEKLTTQTDSLAESTKTLSTAVEDSSAAYEKNQRSIETNALAYEELAVKVEELAMKENKSAAEKKELKTYVDQLNGSVEGLNLVYGKQSQALNMTSEEMANRINLMKEEESLISSQERLTALIKEEIDIGLQLKEVNALQEESIQLYKDGEITKKENKLAVESLKEQEIALSEAHTKAGAERVKVEAQIAESSAKTATAAEKDMGKQLKLYDELDKGLQKTVDNMKSSWEDYKDKASDMFDTIETKSTVSVGKMTKNLEENQRTITKWSENIASLAKRGVDEGLLNTLREAGPESAGHVNALVKASDKELEKLSEAFAKGGGVATDALSKSLGIENTGIMAEVGHLVVNTERALTDQIKAAGFEDVGGAIPEGLVKGVEKGTKGVTDATKKMAEDAEKEFRKSLEIKSPSGVFKKDGVHITEGVTQGVESGIPKVVSTMTKLYKAMIVPFANISTEFQKIGTFAGDGLVTGLKNSEGRVMATARGLANNVAATMRKALDTHSPSKVTTEIGEDTGEGLAIGIESTKFINKKAVDSVGDLIKSATKKNMDEVTKIVDEAEKNRTEIQNDHAKKRAEILSNSSKKTSSIQQQSYKSRLAAQEKAANQRLSNKKTSKAKKTSVQVDYGTKIKDVTSTTNKQLLKLEEQKNSQLEKLNSKTLNDIAKKEQAIYKERLDTVKLYVQDKKTTDELSIVEEAKIWEKSFTSFKVGSKERVEAQKYYKTAVENVSKEILSINKNYQEQMKKVDEDYVKEAALINKEYEDTFKNRVSALLSFAGTFDAFKVELNRTGSELMENLQDQVVGFKKWQEEFEKLSSRGIDDDLLNELSNLGVKALPELVALNSMTNEQLTKYSALYKEKSQLAREQAGKELEGMKKDTDNKLLELRQTADAQLSKLQTEWMLKIKNLTSTTASELSSLRQIGIDAGQGLLDGLGSMEGPLINKAQEIADGIKNAIQSALDIHSPSRWMRDFIVGNMAKGFDVGVDKNKAYLMRSADRLSNIIKPEPIVNLAGTRAMQGVNNNTSNRYDIDKSRTSHTQVTVQSEGDKQDVERMLRRLAFEAGL